MRIDRRPLRMLVDWELTSNYIDAQECATCGIKVEAEHQSEELKMADAIVGRTEG